MWPAGTSSMSTTPISPEASTRTRQPRNSSSSVGLVVAWMDMVLLSQSGRAAVIAAMRPLCRYAFFRANGIREASIGFADAGSAQAQDVPRGGRQAIVLGRCACAGLHAVERLAADHHARGGTGSDPARSHTSPGSAYGCGRGC